jgi:ribosomal-protein-alanine N-acetyltransferase
MEDLPLLHNILGNPNVCEYLPGPKEKSEEDLLKCLRYYVKSFGSYHDTYIFKVSLKDSNTVVGYAGLAYVNEFDKHEIMYGIAEEYWGKGYGTEMSLRMKDLAIEQGHKQVIALADIDNIPSQKILLKTGFREIKQITLWGLELRYYEMEL